MQKYEEADKKIGSSASESPSDDDDGNNGDGDDSDGDSEVDFNDDNYNNDYFSGEENGNIVVDRKSETKDAVRRNLSSDMDATNTFFDNEEAGSQYYAHYELTWLADSTASVCSSSAEYIQYQYLGSLADRKSYTLHKIQDKSGRTHQLWIKDTVKFFSASLSKAIIHGIDILIPDQQTKWPPLYVGAEIVDDKDERWQVVKIFRRVRTGTWGITLCDLSRVRSSFFILGN